MDSPSEIVVHCGLHKTGTTAVQLGLPHYFEQCLSEGIFIYNGDTANASHHALAARLSRNPAKSHDMLAEVVQKIRERNQPKTFISSEDFQSILTSPDTMKLLTDALKSSGADKVTYLIYLRNPVAYLTSMYLTLLFFEHSVPFDDYFEEILATGSYRYRKWKLHFDYRELTESLNEQKMGFAIRDYHNLKGGNAVKDVLGFLGVRGPADLDSTESRKGVTKNKRKFTRYCRHVLGAEQTHPSMFNVFEAHLEETRLFLPSTYKERILERFGESMEFVDLSYGTKILEATQNDVASTEESGLSYPAVFHKTIKADLEPVLPELAAGKRKAVSRDCMKEWGWTT